ncbi:MAG: GIDE domain-containing protein [Polyangiaceae bacterium]
MSSVLWFLAASASTLAAAVSPFVVRSRLSPSGRARRAAERLPKTPVVDAADGEVVRLVGTLELAGAPLVAPFSGRRCAHYEAVVEIPRARGFRRFLVERKSAPFFVRDGSGRALIDDSRMIVEVVIDSYWNAQETDPETRFELERFLYGIGSNGAALLGSANALRYSEGALEEGELVTVIGVAASTGAAGEPQSYRVLPRQVHIRPPTGGALFVSDALHFD